MPIWSVAPVTEQPEIVLVRWTIIETDDGERHLVGFNQTDFEGRVSSAIQTFDSATLRATTESGRVYQLAGAPGHDPDGMHVWGVWAHIAGVQQWREVTGEVLAKLAPCPAAGDGTEKPECATGTEKT